MLNESFLFVHMMFSGCYTTSRHSEGTRLNQTCEVHSDLSTRVQAVELSHLQVAVHDAVTVHKS